MNRLIAVLTVALSSAWTMPGAAQESVRAVPVTPPKGRVLLRGTMDGSPISGVVRLSQAMVEGPSGERVEGLLISATISGAAPGLHGFHIHEFGSCEDGGTAAGGHYNPRGVKHGHLPADGLEGAHAGDLGNVEIRPDGTGTLEGFFPGLTLQYGPYPAVAGRAIILHEYPDDFRQPAGNAGGRIACGIIGMSE